MLTTLFSTIAISAGAVCALTALTYSCVYLVLYTENRRFWQARFRQMAPTSDSYPRCRLVVPCKGLEHGLRDNLAGFLRQDYPNYEVAFVVEEARDPAIPVIRELIREHRFVKASLLIAGRADVSGQKVHNLRAATADLPSEIEILVFADSDAGTKNTWLRWLTGGIGQQGVGARTGYRWMTPLDKKLPTLLGCSINNAVASMFGNGGHFLVWGGAWAIHRKVFDAASLREAWTGTLSDDLVASRVLKFSGLDIRFEPRCICTSPVSFTWAGLFEFLSRQLVIGRVYATGYWLAALFITLCVQIAYWGGLIGGVALAINGSSAGYWLIGLATLLYFGGVARGTLRQSLGRLSSARWRTATRTRNFDRFAGPLIGLYLAVVFVRSIFGRKITWRNVRYQIGRSGKIQLLGRKVEAAVWTTATDSETRIGSEAQTDGQNARRKSA